nr:MAG TPA: hypothetical protein [Caudoviricetes sp.]
MCEVEFDDEVSENSKKEARYIVFASFFLCRTMLFSVVRDF